jgi:hypothetical protein
MPHVVSTSLREVVETSSALENFAAALKLELREMKMADDDVGRLALVLYETHQHISQAISNLEDLWESVYRTNHTG